MIEILANFLGRVASDAIADLSLTPRQLRECDPLGRFELEIRAFQFRPGGWHYDARLIYTTHGYVNAALMGREPLAVSELAKGG